MEFVTTDAQDDIRIQWMSHAMTMANEALTAGEVPVGCAFVRNSAIIAAARNRTNEFRNVRRFLHDLNPV